MNYITSQESLKLRMRNMNLLSLLIPIGIIVFMYFTIYIKSGTVDDFPLFIKLAGGISIFMIVELQIVSRVMLRKVRNLSVTLDESGFDRINVKNTERFQFDEFDNAIATFDHKNEKLMMVKFKGKKRTVVLAGFENMEEIFEHIKNVGMQTSTKKFKADWNSPFITTLVFVGTLFIMGLILALKGEIFDYVVQLFQIVFALWFIVFKPVSRSSGEKFRAFEYILGGLILVCAIFIIVTKFLGA